MSLTFTAQVNNIPNPRGSLRAFATLIVNDILQINGFRIVEGRNGIFVSPPQTKGNKLDENGNAIYYNDVRFDEPVEEGTYRGPVAESAFKAILDQYNTANSTSGAADVRPQPSNARPQTRAKRW